jgi:hypothetical protein
MLFYPLEYCIVIICKELFDCAAMSLGWIIVIVMGFVPLLLVYLTSGNTEENQPRRDGARNDTTPRSTKKKNFVYSSWRVVLVVNVRYIFDSLNIIVFAR